MNAPLLRSGRADGPADAVSEIEANRDALRERAREVLGIAGDANTAPLGRTVRESGVGWYPLVALVILISIDSFQTTGLVTLGPDIARTLGISAGTIGALYALYNLALGLATLPMAAYTQSHPRRAAISIVTAIGWSVATVFTGFTASSLGLAMFLTVNGAASGSVRAVHVPLLFDTYPAGIRGRLLSTYLGAIWFSLVLGPALIGLLSLLDFTWRGVFLVMGCFSVVCTLIAVRLRDPGFGRWDTERVRAAVRTAEASSESSLEPSAHSETRLRFFEILRRLLLIATVKRMLVAYIVLGMMLSPLVTFMSFYLDERWHQGPVGRSVFSVISNGLLVPILLYSGRYIERLYRRDPALLVKLAGLLLGGGILILCIGIVLPVYVLMLVVTSLGMAAFAMSISATGMALGSIVPARMRVHASAISNIALYGAGGLLGQFFLAGVYGRSGPTAAIIALSVPGVLAGVTLYSAHRTINPDLDGLLDDIIEQEELDSFVASGRRLPMLACRHVDFFYGSVQTLFGVSFSVDAGEMVCLLGTNGAGKSTLLKVISGHLLPTRGSVRLRGMDVTYVEAPRRTKLGVQYIAGGHGTFGQLTVVENLRAFGYTRGRGRNAIEAGVEETFAAFPRLAERRNQRASTLSGGENQMLALGRAFILKPELLIIDELSLGLAPKLVGELLETVRRINASGTSVVLVEQSVNIALSLVDHAYFMEKGQMRFDGSASELRQRDDLLRSVFLRGATETVVSD